MAATDLVPVEDGGGFTCAAPLWKGTTRAVAEAKRREAGAGDSGGALVHATISGATSSAKSHVGWYIGNHSNQAARVFFANTGLPAAKVAERLGVTVGDLVLVEAGGGFACAAALWKGMTHAEAEAGRLAAAAGDSATGLTRARRRHACRQSALPPAAGSDKSILLKTCYHTKSFGSAKKIRGMPGDIPFGVHAGKRSTEKWLIWPVNDAGEVLAGLALDAYTGDHSKTLDSETDLKRGFTSTEGVLLKLKDELPACYWAYAKQKPRITQAQLALYSHAGKTSSATKKFVSAESKKGQKRKRQSASKPGPKEPPMFKGVSWDKQRQKWVAHTRVAGGKKVRLGRFGTQEMAARAYEHARKQLAAGRKIVASWVGDLERLCREQSLPAKDPGKVKRARKSHASFFGQQPPPLTTTSTGLGTTFKGRRVRVRLRLNDSPVQPPCGLAAAPSKLPAVDIRIGNRHDDPPVKLSASGASGGARSPDDGDDWDSNKRAPTPGTGAGLPDPSDRICGLRLGRGHNKPQGEPTQRQVPNVQEQLALPQAQAQARLSPPSQTQEPPPPVQSQAQSRALQTQSPTQGHPSPAPAPTQEQLALAQSQAQARSPPQTQTQDPAPLVQSQAQSRALQTQSPTQARSSLLPQTQARLALAQSQIEPTAPQTHTQQPRPLRVVSAPAAPADNIPTPDLAPAPAPSPVQAAVLAPPPAPGSQDSMELQTTQQAPSSQPGSEAPQPPLPRLMQSRPSSESQELVDLQASVPPECRPSVKRPAPETTEFSGPRRKRADRRDSSRPSVGPCDRTEDSGSSTPGDCSGVDSSNGVGWPECATEDADGYDQGRQLERCIHCDAYNRGTQLCGPHCRDNWFPGSPRGPSCAAPPRAGDTSASGSGGEGSRRGTAAR